MTDEKPDLQVTLQALTDAMMANDAAIQGITRPIYMHINLLNAIKSSPFFGDRVAFHYGAEPRFSGRPVVPFNDKDVWFHLGEKQDE